MLRTSTLILGTLLVAVLAAPAPAEKVDFLRPNAHTLSGQLADGQEHYVPLELPAGTELSFKLRPARGSGLLPEALLVAPDGTDVEIPSGVIKAKKGFDVKGLPLEQTGEHMLVLRSRNGSSGGFTLKVKARYPENVKGEVAFETGDPLELRFVAQEGCRVGADVRRVKGGARPVNPRVGRPGELLFAPRSVRASKAGFRFAKHEIEGALGESVLQFAVDLDDRDLERRFKYRLKLSYPKYDKAKLSPGDLAVKPRIESVSPSHVDRELGETDVEVRGRFFLPGARVELRRLGESWSSATAAVTSESISTSIDARGRSVGRWDVVVRNGTGGEARVHRALVVRPDAPEVTSVAPSAVSDDQPAVTLSVEGRNLTGSIAVRLVRSDGAGEPGELTITGVRSFGGQRASIDVETLRQPLGHYDMLLFTYPEAEPDLMSREVRVERALEIVNAPPRLTSYAPERVVEDGPIDVELEGAEIEDGATVHLLLGDESAEVSGVTVTDGSRVTGHVNMTAATPGRWSVRVTNPDGQSAMLEDVYHHTRVVTASLDVPLLGEPDLSLAEEHACALVTWLQSDEAADGTGTEWAIYGRRFALDDEDWDGPAFRISGTDDDGVLKRDVSAAYNPQEDAWLVVWSQETSVDHVWDLWFSGATTVSADVFQPRARRVSVEDGVEGNVVAFADHDGTTIWNSTTTAYHDEFEYRGPRATYVNWDEAWYVTVTRRTDDISVAGGGLTAHNYDVIMFRLDSETLLPNRDVTIYDRPRYEAACTAVVDDVREEILTIASIEVLSPTSNTARNALRLIEVLSPTSNTARNALRLEGRSVDSVGRTSPAQWSPPYVYSSAPIVLVSESVLGSGGADRPIAVYDEDGDSVLVAFQVVDPQGLDPTEVHAARIDAEELEMIGELIALGVDEDHHMMLPRVALDVEASEALVTFTLDALTGTPRALGKLLGTGTGEPSKEIQLGPSDSGLPVAGHESGRDRYVILCVTGYEAVGVLRSGTGLRLELLD
jgi:hypothetical protein